MSRFSILRVDSYDPVKVGKRSRIMYIIYATIPFIVLQAINIINSLKVNINIGLLITIPLIGLIYYFLLKKVRSTISGLKTIGEIEITQSCLRKRLGDSVTEYGFHIIREIYLIKHIPSTRLKESKSRYFSYIFKIVLHDGKEESMVLSDRSVDHNQKMSLAETMKTLKKIAPFEVNLEI
jgi:hypothetical protein